MSLLCAVLLVSREFRLWHSRLGVRLFTPQDAALFVDMRDDFGLVTDGRRVFRFACADEASWATVSAWLSRVRSPSVEEVLAFIGPGSEPAP